MIDANGVVGQIVPLVRRVPVRPHRDACVARPEAVTDEHTSGTEPNSDRRRPDLITVHEEVRDVILDIALFAIDGT
jgi:hypothetical protein